MKRIIFFAFLCFCASLSAQDLEFRYKGEALKDGATVTIVAEEDFFGEMSCETNPSSDPLNGLVLKSNPVYSNSISAELEILSNTLNAAVVQWCMGGECSLMRNKTQQTKSFPPEENIQVLFDATNIRNEGALMAKLTVTLRGESKTVFIQFVNGDTDGIRTPSLTPSPSPRRGDADAVYDLSGRKIASQLSTFASQLSTFASQLSTLNSRTKFASQLSTLNSKLNKGIYIYNGKKFVK